MSSTSPSPARRIALHPHRMIPLLLAIVVLTLALGACGQPKQQADSGVPAATPLPPPDPSRPALISAAAALDKRDAEVFAASLAGLLREAVTGRLDLTGAGAPSLAKALRDARLIAEYESTRVYETTVNGMKFTFYAVKEGDQWKLAGL